jgi:membrane-bound lytic murein transglycosylase D
LKKIFYLIPAFFLFYCTTNNALNKQETSSVDNEFCDTDSLKLKLVRIDSIYGEITKAIALKDSDNVSNLLEDGEAEISKLSQAEVTEIEDDSVYSKILSQMKELNKFFVKESAQDTLAEEELVRSEINEMLDDTSNVELSNAPRDIFDNSLYSIPVTDHKKVKNAIKYFTERERGRRVFQEWLDKGSRYKELIHDILEEEGLPKDLFYLAMIESGFRTNARSWASAVGPWQFMSYTGRAYGLNISYWADDRRDVEASTRAAARHLKDLHKRFGDWYLAMAGYNCNPAKIARSVRQQNTKDYFALKYIPRETRGYVPNFLAAMIIGKNIEQFGFRKGNGEPLEYDRIYIKDVIDLNHIANAAEVDYEIIKELNPAITKWVTPSDRDSMFINIPAGTADIVLSFIDSLPDDQKQKFIRYRIQSGDALSLIARKFNVRLSELKSINKLQSNNIRVGWYLIVPQPYNSKYYIAQKNEFIQKKKYKKRIVAVSKANSKTHEKVIYEVKSGDTLGHIAEDFSTHARNIRQWNGIAYGQALRLGQKLTIWKKNDVIVKRVPRSSDEKIQLDQNFEYHKVKYGETLWDIAIKYKTSIDSLKKLNNLADSNIRKGTHLIVAEKTAK